MFYMSLFLLGTQRRWVSLFAWWRPSRDAHHRLQHFCPLPRRAAVEVCDEAAALQLQALIQLHLRDLQAAAVLHLLRRVPRVAVGQVDGGAGRPAARSA